MGRPLVRRTVPTRVRENRTQIRNEERKPVIADNWIYVGDYVGFDDPGNDPAGTTLQSPPFLNDFYYIDGFPIAFRHGVDGQTDMIGMYDLTLGAVSGTTAFLMPLQWAMELPVSAMFPIELEPDVWSIAVQTCDTVNLVSGKAPIKVFWPIVADPVP